MPLCVGVLVATQKALGQDSGEDGFLCPSQVPQEPQDPFTPS